MSQILDPGHAAVHAFISYVKTFCMIGIMMEVHSSSMQHKRIASLEWGANAEQIMVNRARKAEELAAALAASKEQPIPTGMEPQPLPLGTSE